MKEGICNGIKCGGIGLSQERQEAREAAVSLYWMGVPFHKYAWARQAASALAASVEA